MPSSVLPGYNLPILLLSYTISYESVVRCIEQYTFRTPGINACSQFTVSKNRDTLQTGQNKSSCSESFIRLVIGAFEHISKRKPSDQVRLSGFLDHAVRE